MVRENRIQLITYQKQGKQGHVSQDTVNEFEKAVISDKIETIEAGPMAVYAGKLFRKLVIKRNFPFFPGIIPKKKTHRLCILMGVELHKPFVPFCFNRSNHVYFFDAWPDRHLEIERFIKAMNIKNVFFSSAQATMMFKQKKIACNFHWISEGIDLTEYSFKGYQQKDIDVLSFGRKYDPLHDKIATGLNNSNITYLYEKTKGEIIFKDRSSFIDGLARTKISICIPSNITHPERAGNISTMTIRYLQSMASKALVLGFMPDDMKELFDYEPLIPLDMNDPLEQIKNILENFPAYSALIEKNYNFIKEHHTWTNRWIAIQKILNNSSLI